MTDPITHSSSPLSGLVVIDLSRILAGPYCTMMLGDLGAEVLKIESPRGDDSRAWGPPFSEGESAYFLSVNRNKKGLCLDLKNPDGCKILHRLLDTADVLVENFRPGTLGRLGFAPDELQKKYPRLVCCSISGYGQDGPYRDRGGFDAIMQAEGGWMGLTGHPDGPPTKVGASLGDIFAGMMASQGILSALYERQRTGKGRLVDVSLFDSVVSTLCYQAQGYFMTGNVPSRLGNRHPSLAPYETFETSDSHVVVGVGNDALWNRFCDAIEHPPLEDERFRYNAGRVEHYDALRNILVAIFRSNTTAHWVALMDRFQIPVGEVRDLDAVFKNPQIQARQMRMQVEHPTVGSMDLVGNPIHMPGFETPTSPPPLLGEHTESVLRERLGIAPDEIARLRESGALGGRP